ncbi:hypothetical protein FKW77_008176 [Venturia effusa]|uniref:Uncharacterized protein n=1 Tax=Venturia effusa TaxID=50376 RepID=A0A517L9Q2_9PEZI|nr:hypothetical protein FKW77_008176 [Venturia effusa]
MATFKGAYFLSNLTSLTTCRRCILRATTQQRRTLTSELKDRISTIRPIAFSPRIFQANQRRNVSSDAEKHSPSPSKRTDHTAQAHSQQRADLEKLRQNIALISPPALATKLPNSGLVIYQAPPQRRYITVGWIVGTLFLTIGINTIAMREWSPTGLPMWSKIGNWVVVVFCCFAAFYPISSTLGLCRRITAFPIAKQKYGMTLVVEGSYYWTPWKTRIVKAKLEDVLLRRNMAACVAGLSKPGPRLPMDQVPTYIRPFAKFGSAVGSYVTEIPGVLLRHTHVSMLIRKGKALDSVTFKLDVRGQMFGGPRGSSIRL